MKKIGQKEILEAILSEALTIKRKKELFKEAKKIDTELKQLNEERWQGLGHGFKGYEGPSPVMGLSTQSTYEPAEEDESPCFDHINKLGDEMKDFETSGIEIGGENNDIQSLKDENEELKAKLEQIQNALGALNEGFFDNAKAAWQGVKSGIEAGQQQYQQTQQSQQVEAMKKKAIAALQSKMAELNSIGKNVNPQDISAILQQFGLKYLGKKQGGPKVVALTEGEQPVMEELDEIFGKFGAMVGGAAKKVAGDVVGAAQNVAGKVQGAAQNVADKVQQYGQQVGAAAQASGQQYDASQEEKQVAAQAHQEKLQQVSNYNSNVFNAAINALQNYAGE